MARPISATIDIAQAPEAVFEYATDPARFPEWQDGVVEAHPDATTAGDYATFTTTRRVGPRKLVTRQAVVTCSKPNVWAVEGIDGPVRANVTLTINGLDGGAGSRVALQFRYVGRGIGRILVPLVVRPGTRSAAPRALRALKTRMEATGDADVPGQNASGR